MKLTSLLLSVLLFSVMTSAGFAAHNTAISTPGAQGYDLVSYHSESGPVKGSGHYVTVYEDVTYLFSSKENQQAFEMNPEKYLPAYGGYCAFGVSVGKKFVGDPEVWKIVDGTLYLNLDKNIQKDWEKDIPGRIAAANTKWEKIKDVPPEEL